MGSTWGPEGPPEEAYSRVTNPERFQPLIPYTEELIARLESDFVVLRREGSEVDALFRPRKFSRPSVQLVPTDGTAAPMAFGFLPFPGISVLVGRWLEPTFPHCGCDACDETAGEAEAELMQLVDDVVHGRLIEYVEIPAVGDGWLGSRQGGPGRHEGGSTRIPRKEAKSLVARAGGKYFDYGPWPKREL